MPLSGQHKYFMKMRRTGVVAVGTRHHSTVETMKQWLCVLAKRVHLLGIRAHRDRQHFMNGELLSDSSLLRFTIYFRYFGVSSPKISLKLHICGFFSSKNETYFVYRTSVYYTE